MPILNPNLTQEDAIEGLGLIIEGLDQMVVQTNVVNRDGSDVSIRMSHDLAFFGLVMGVIVVVLLVIAKK